MKDEDAAARTEKIDGLEKVLKAVKMGRLRKKAAGKAREF